jgi:hypothetical protein
MKINPFSNPLYHPPTFLRLTFPPKWGKKRKIDLFILTICFEDGNLDID